MIRRTTVEEHTAEGERQWADEIWVRVASSKSFEATSLLMAEPVILFAEAVKCYKSGHFMASTLLSRSALESALYRMAVAKNIEFEDDPKTGLRIRTYSYEDNYVKIGENYNLIEQYARRKFYISKELYCEIYNVRCQGNFVAHYSPRLDKEFAKLVEKIRRRIADPTQPIQLWVDEKTAPNILEKTANILLDFMYQVSKKANRKPSRPVGVGAAAQPKPKPGAEAEPQQRVEPTKQAENSWQPS